MPAIVRAIQVTTTVRLWARTQRVREDMARDANRRGARRKRPRGRCSGPTVGGRAVRPGVDSGAGGRRYARVEVPDRPHRRLDAAIAVAVFAAALGLVAVGDVDGGAVNLVAAVVLTALASLPLLARRRAPRAVFVLTSLASIALRGFAQPPGPPLGPTLALYWVAAGDDGSRARIRATLALAAGLLLAHYGAALLREGGLPGTESLLGVLLWGGAWLAGERTRLRRERMAELEERALRAEREAERERRLAAAEERTRIARDLHDAAATEGRDDDVEPPAGLAALPSLVERHRAAGLHVTSAVRGEPRQLPRPVDRGAYRIL